MKILLTGATGFLGQHVMNQALASGHTIRALCWQEPKPGDFTIDVEIVLGDLGNMESLEKAAEGCDVLILCPFLLTQPTGVENLISAAFKSGCRRVVYTSTFFFLGSTKDKIANENWTNLESWLPLDINKSKARAEIWTRLKQEEGLDIVSVYPGVMYGPAKNTEDSLINQLISDYLKRRAPGIIGKGNTRFTLSYVEDVAKGHLLALEKGKKGGRYILGGEEVSEASLIELLHSITGIRPPSFKTPYWLGRIIAWKEEIHQVFQPEYHPRLTLESLAIYSENWRYSSQKAIREIGYTRTLVKVGLLKTLESLGYTPPTDRSVIL